MNSDNTRHIIEVATIDGTFDLRHDAGDPPPMLTLSYSPDDSMMMVFFQVTAQDLRDLADAAEQMTADVVGRTLDRLDEEGDQ